MKLEKLDLLIFLFLLFALSLTFAGHGAVVDENLIIQVLDSIFERGDLTVHEMFQAIEGPDGKHYSRYGFGFPLALIPFYGLGEVLESAFGDAYAFCGDPHFFALLLGQLIFTALAGWAFYRVCLELGAGRGIGFILILVLIFGTPFWPYSQPLFRLTFSTLILLLTYLFVLRFIRKNDITSLITILCLVAYGLNVREDLALAFFVMGIVSLWKQPIPKTIKLLSTFFIGGLSGLVMWGLHNYIRFDTFFIENYADLSFNYPWLISIPALLFGPTRGIFTYAPVLVLFLISWHPCKKHEQLDKWVLGLCVFLVYLFLYASSSMWHGGQCWGPRHMYFIIPFQLMTLIWVLKYFDWKALWATIGLMVAGMVMNWPGLYAHHGKYESFFESPPFFPLLLEYPKHPVIVIFDELDLWWIRMIKLNPISLWPLAFVGVIAFTEYLGYRIYKNLHEINEN